MTKEHRIPHRADAGIQFAGVDMADAVPVIAGIFGAMMFGKWLGVASYILLPAVGFGASKAWLNWKKTNPAGHAQALMYATGIYGYSKAFTKKKKLFVGDGAQINPARNRLFDLNKKED